MTTATPNDAVTIHITQLDIHSPDVGGHVDWLARMMMVGVDGYGVLSAEIIPPATHDETKWTLVQRFHKPEDIEKWRVSTHREKLLAELQPHLASNHVSLSENVDSTYGTVGNVAVAVVTHVKPGHDSAYCQCEQKFQSLQSRSAGYRGAYIQPPTSGTPGLWTTIIRFDNAEALDEWFQSSERQKLLDESAKHVESTDFQTVATSYPGFFSKESGGKGPPNWKTALLILLGLYPVVMLEIHYVNPLLTSLSSPIANFITMIGSVVATTWGTMPAFIKLYSSWLFPTKQTPAWVGPASLASLVFLFVIEVILLGRLP